MSKTVEAVAKKTSTKTNKVVKKADKPTKKTKTVKVERVNKDNARWVAKVSEGKFTSDQIRILRALKGSKGAITRGDLKELVGIGRDGMYSQKWLDSLKDLETRKLLKIKIAEEGSEHRGYTHEITALGTNNLEKAEASFVKAEKAEAK